MRRLASLALVLLGTLPVRAALPPDVDQALRTATYVYLQSERKTGEWSKPAEIWFEYAEGKVCVATRPTSWRVKRIGWKRTKARIAVGAPTGPAFEARGQIVKDPAVERRLMAAYAKKYPEGWTKFEKVFQDGFKSGDRVIV